MFFIDPEVCTGCGECKDACPCDAISEDENGRCVIDTDLCADCGACLDVCEFGSIFEASQEEIESLKIQFESHQLRFKQKIWKIPAEIESLQGLFLAVLIVKPDGIAGGLIKNRNVKAVERNINVSFVKAL